MHPSMINPFDAAADPDRHYIWQRLVAVDSDAFVLGDWSMTEPDFDAERFEGIRAHGSSNPDDWRIAFADLPSYRDNWLNASREFLKKQFVGLTHRETVYRRTRLTEIEIAGDRALCHKKFSGELPLVDGTTLSGSRQTLYRLHKQAGVWRIVGFIGYLPLNM
jgi:hypothetical protein